MFKKSNEVTKMIQDCKIRESNEKQNNKEKDEYLKFLKRFWKSKEPSAIYRNQFLISLIYPKLVIETFNYQKYGIRQKNDKKYRTKNSRILQENSVVASFN